MSGVCIDGLTLVLHETHGVSGVLRTLAYSYFLNDRDLRSTEILHDTVRLI
jgi:hypothetical protein